MDKCKLLRSEAGEVLSSLVMSGFYGGNRVGGRRLIKIVRFLFFYLDLKLRFPPQILERLESKATSPGLCYVLAWCITVSLDHLHNVLLSEDHAK